MRENLPTLGDVVVVILGKEGEGKREVAVVEKLLMLGEMVVVAVEKGKRSGSAVLSHESYIRICNRTELTKVFGHI